MAAADKIAMVIAALSMASCACRSNFDAAPDADGAESIDGVPSDGAAGDPTIELTLDASEAVVSIPGRFEVTFASSRRWQPVRWTETGREGDLSGAGIDSQSGSVMTPLIICGMGDCVGAEAMTDVAFSARLLDSRSVEISMSWSWMLSGVALEGDAVYIIDIGGSWNATASVTNKSAVPLSGSIEIADVHVNQALGWFVADDDLAPSFEFRLPATAQAGETRLEVTHLDAVGASIANDEANNRYFVRSLSLAAGETDTATWTMQIWRAL